MIDNIFTAIHTRARNIVLLMLFLWLSRFAVLRFFLFIRFYLVKLECIIFWGISLFLQHFQCAATRYTVHSIHVLVYKYERSCFILFYVKLIGLFYVFVIEIPRFYYAFSVLCRFWSFHLLYVLCTVQCVSVGGFMYILWEQFELNDFA